jgi:hypothetical protein
MGVIVAEASKGSPATQGHDVFLGHACMYEVDDAAMAEAMETTMNNEEWQNPRPERAARQAPVGHRLITHCIEVGSETSRHLLERETHKDTTVAGVTL